MESYSQPWTVINKCEQYQTEPKSYEYWPAGGVEGIHHQQQQQQHKKPHYECGFEKCEGPCKTYSNKWENKPQYCGGKWEKQGEREQEWSSKWEKPTEYRGGKWEKQGQQEWSSKWEKPTEYCGGKWEKQGEREQEWSSKWEKPTEYCGGKWEKQGEREQEWSSKWENKPEYCGGKWEQEWSSKWEKPTEYRSGNGKWENKPEWRNIEKVCGELEKVCDSFERLERPGQQQRYQRQHWQQEQQGRRYEGETSQKPFWRCNGQKCCDVEMVNMVKDMINILIGAEQSYIQLGFLCMDEKFTLVNTSEYFRLCGLRMHWLANGLINKSVRLFNVNEWINQTTFENFFKVPTKEELATNDYTSILKTFFKIAMEAETRLVERMNVLGEKMAKADWVNSECRFDGFKWFVNFVLPYQTHFVREMNGHWNNIQMCNNGFIFDKCEMYPLVQKIEEFIHQITRIHGCPVFEKNLILSNKRW